ncbi:putative oxidoreductase protein [Diplogelasinospora grovesii]|uniref:Oxidoreductase protein n=1 Tax=Diplogelasinospora grovesii TaxID=303347 RepID=A0AAN6N3Y8_9PEZI|nr:putative oxidoreductase protein [Diplogelasinospora grovesii]
MAAIRKVALAGGSGRLGPAILDQLLQHNFDVTVLTRQESTATFPAAAKVQRVDYSSKESLVSALQGQDAVVSAIANSALDKQLLLIDAAVEAGVRRFLPSEFGSDTTNPKAASLPVFRHKVMAQKALAERAAASTSGFTYTTVITGPLLGWAVTQAFMSIKEKNARLYDGGDRVFSTSTMTTIGKAICSVLAHPAETENRVVKVHGTATTLNKLLAAAQKAVGEDGWTVTKPSVDELLGSSWAGVKQGKFDWPTLFGFVVTACQGEGYGGRLENTDNKLLGIPEMTDAEVQAVIDQIAKH